VSKVKAISPRSKTSDTALRASRIWASEVARLAEDRNCTNISVLELVGISPVAKHFVICTGTSSQQIRSVAREMEAEGKEHGFKVYGMAGLQQGRWVVVDFVDVVVHLFDGEYRQFYDLEMLWGDAPRVKWQRAKGKGKSSHSEE